MILSRIKNAISEGRINITEHADDELAKDNISNKSLYHSVMHGKMIENYQDDFPFPSCLIFGRDENGRPIQSVWAFVEGHDTAILITAYIPDANRWVNYERRR